MRTARRSLFALVVAAALTGTLMGPAMSTEAAFTDAGSVGASLTTVPPVTLDFVDLAAGEDYSLGWTSDGQLFSWGFNDRGQLGTGDTQDRDIPTHVLFPDPVTITDADAGINTSIALTSAGEVYTWGNSDIGGNTNSPQKVVALEGATVVGVASGGYFYLAWTGEGKLYSWGTPGGGRLGRGGSADTPALVTAQGTSAGFVTTADAGRFYGTAVLDNGSRVTTWGQDHGSATGVTTTGLPAGTVIAGMSAGNNFTFAWSTDGALFAESSGVYTQPTAPAGYVGAQVSIQAFGGSSFYTWRDTGELFAWGENSDGQLGLGDNTDKPAPVPVTLPADATIRGVASGGAHALITADGGAYSAAGSNNAGQLGSGTLTPRNTFSTPVVVRRWP
ncbi:RCC1 domain-containing protein [Microbacterium sp. Leaf320]|uniref:RCC1 domain-containing protein n=1 Tax=Microbacterium sp. Leaf320 TaxID=1736334 RepID=UPI0007126D26|nr:hypothetical protein [Microbacterium sp. Leaf320]KQQ65380.1 hypothetical protein ASF63_15705 [Microbacterium sp. Leaf320]